MEHQKQQVFQQSHRHTVDGSEREGCQQLRQIGHVQLHKGGDQGRDGEFDEHQQEGHGGQHGGHCQLVGAVPAGRAGSGDSACIGFRHKKHSFFCLKTPWML